MLVIFLILILEINKAFQIMCMVQQPFNQTVKLKLYFQNKFQLNLLKIFNENLRNLKSIYILINQKKKLYNN